MRFITADTHFNHPSILNSCKETRGHFKSIEEMNETIIRNWNNKVGGEDTVYHLGDIAVKMSNRPLFELLKRLNGKIVFVKGNHDDQITFNWLERGNYKYAKGKKFIFHEVGLIIKENKKEYYLTHYPMDLGYQSVKRRNFHGHIHGKTVDKESCLNVGVDSPETGNRPFGQPINWNEAVKLLEEKRKM
ncbi:metallophosphatase [Tetragenococcus halophilus subsp. flandriensis]|uniref:metallophosphoesterase n=1 Tax=Tetragenococcus halophilus TaxID=51669 RepID=UPI0023E9D104|nr:metallophosphoesterase [Tetragenococcus halophilus]GMA08332.1 metallophosphatase [Tetragenococcus halophilus subsp. flandriensis]